MTRRYRIAFLMQQVLGHVTHSAGLERAVRADPDIDPIWAPISYWREGGWIERLPGVTQGARGVARAATEVRRTLARGDIDAILFNSPALAVSATRWMQRIPTTISLDVTARQFDREAAHFNHHADDSGRVAAWKHRWNIGVFTRCAGLAPWSTWTRASLLDDYGVDPSVIQVIPPGVDVDEWAPRAVRRAQALQILFVGGNFRRKGGDVLVDWFRQRGRGRCELHIVSNDPAVDGIGDIDIHVHRGLEPNGHELRQLYWGSDAFVLPSRSEPFGIACVEALAAGLPVVAARVGGLTDIVDNGESGYLVKPGDDLELGAALDSLLGSEPRRRAMGARGMEAARLRFDARTNYCRLLDMLKASVDDRANVVQPAAAEAVR